MYNNEFLQNNRTEEVKNKSKESLEEKSTTESKEEVENFAKEKIDSLNTEAKESLKISENEKSAIQDLDGNIKELENLTNLIDVEIENVKNNATENIMRLAKLENSDSTESDFENSENTIKDFDYKYEELAKKKNKIELLELRQLAEVSYKKIKEHAKDLGIEISDFSSEKIDFLSQDNSRLGQYSSTTDRIQTISKSIKVIIHEELHFATAIDNRGDSKTLNDHRMSKSGFHSVWVMKNKNTENHDILRGFNEAVTEKITEEIFSENKDKILFDFEEGGDEIKNLRREVASEERDLELEGLKNKEHLMIAYENSNFLDEFFEEPPKSLDGFLDERKRDIESKYNQTLNSNQDAEIVKNDVAYSNETRVLNAILNKLAIKRATREKILINEAEIIEWRELQRAYFKGDTMYLKNIEKNITPGILRKLSELMIPKKDESGVKMKEDFIAKTNSLIKLINEAS